MNRNIVYRRRPVAPAGFSLVELLFVIGIIAILIAITVPVVSRVRKQAQTAGVQNQIQTLGAQVQAYQQTHGSYPGPIPDKDPTGKVAIYTAPTGTPTQLQLNTPAATATSFETVGFDATRITQAENLVLGLCGGLKLVQQQNNFVVYYDPAMVGNGALNLNNNNIKKFSPFADTKHLSWRLENNKRTGKYKDEGGEAQDSLIPEFVDQFNNPLPILYLRARKGVEGNQYSNVINTYTTQSGVGTVPQQYELKDIWAYTAPNQGRYIGTGKTFSMKDFAAGKGVPTNERGGVPHGLYTVVSPAITAGASASSLDKGATGKRVYHYPYDAYAYFEDPANRWTDTPTLKQGLPRAKDAFILVSAGADRVYGTRDDICSFGNVAP